MCSGLCGGVLLPLLAAQSKTAQSKTAQSKTAPGKAAAKRPPAKKSAPSAKTSAAKAPAKPAVAPLAAEPLVTARARAYAEGPTVANRAALEAFAKAHATEQRGALALLALAVVDLDNRRAAQALSTLEKLGQRLPALHDYVAHHAARALVDLGRKDEALAKLAAVIAAKPPSPFRATAVLMTATLRTQAGETASLVPLLRESLAELPQPKGLTQYAAALEAAGDLTAAAIQFQRVHHEYPLAAEAAEAAAALARIQSALGDAYPPAMAGAMLRRVSLLIDGGQTKRALDEIDGLLPQLGGEDRDLAEVRRGVAHYAAGQNLAALNTLRAISIPASEANAERLHYYLAAARRLGREDDMKAALESLAAHHPHSPWRLEALVAMGNHLLLRNRHAEYEPVYAACADLFPGEVRAAYCHWKVAWVHYLHRRPTAPEMLRDHLQKFPHSENAATALYFLGRLSEYGADHASAKAYYEAIPSRYPGYFYATQARDRLAAAPVASAAASPAARAWIESLPLRTAAGSDFAVDTPTRVRIDRARLLASAALDQLAESELRYGARTDARPQAVAFELARIANRRGAADQGIRYVKAFAPAYLHWPLETAPRDFWRYAYPMPFQESIEKHSLTNSLDPHLMAGLIRQESEFNPRAVSRAKAIGLTQVMPATGLGISRRLRVPFSTAMLYRPEENLRLGTWYLRNMIDSLNGDLTAALAAYNAGKSRADLWLTWGEFREPAEFIETIPFSETRNYVQTVLRNADMYRRLYSPSEAASRRTGENAADGVAH